MDFLVDCPFTFIIKLLRFVPEYIVMILAKPYSSVLVNKYCSTLSGAVIVFMALLSPNTSMRRSCSYYMIVYYGFELLKLHSTKDDLTI